MSLELIFSEQGLWMALKAGFLIAYVLYVLFAVVVSAQVKQMTKTIDAGMNGKLLTAAKIHLVLAISFLVIAVLVL